MALDASDGLAEAFADGNALGADLAQMLQDLSKDDNFALQMIMSLLVMIFSFTLFIVLFVRKIAVLAIAIFTPLYLAGQGSATSQNWMRRAAEMMAALILVKPAVYLIFKVGANLALEDGGSAADTTLRIMTAVALMIAAILSPFALFRIIGFADTQLTRSIGGSGGRRSAAPFGKGAGAMLGSTSRETFRGIGARMQTRGRGAIGTDAGRGSGIGIGAGADAGGRTALPIGTHPFSGRPSIRPGRRPSVPAGTSARAIAPAGGGSGGGGGTAAVRSGGAPRVRTGQGGGSSAGTASGGGAPRVRAAAPRASGAGSSSAAAPAARPNPPARHVRTAAALPPGRSGGRGR
jgi:hypothetical protein